MDSWEELGGWLENRTPTLMDSTKRFAVVVPVVRVDGVPHILYEVRASHMRKQPGEICFPGGRVERGESPVEAALRECWEELAIGKEQITPLGQLDFVAHRCNYLIHPILATVDVEGMRYNPDEVAETFLVPLSHLANHPDEVYSCTLTPQPEEGFSYQNIGMKGSYRWQVGREQMPVYRWNDRIIWGLTGRITRNLLSLLREGGMEL